MAAASRTLLLRQSVLNQALRPLNTASRAASIALRPASRTSLRTPPSTTSSLLPRLAPFSTTSQKSILPPGPQVIDGGVNDPAPVPKPSPIHGSYHWTFERALSIGLIPLTIAPFAAGSLNPSLDAVLIFGTIVHSHMGFKACVTDYFSTKKHPTLRRSMDWILNIATVLVAIGFYEFETNDVGVTEAIRRIWTAGRNDATIGKTDVDKLGHDGKLKHLTS